MLKLVESYNVSINDYHLVITKYR